MYYWSSSAYIQNCIVFKSIKYTVKSDQWEFSYNFELMCRSTDKKSHPPIESGIDLQLISCQFLGQHFASQKEKSVSWFSNWSTMTGQKCLVSKSYTISVPLVDQRLLSVGPIDVTFLRQNDFSMQCFYSQMHFTFFFPQNCPFKKKFNLGERDNVACFPRFF